VAGVEALRAFIMPERVSPPWVTTADEETARHVFSQGEAVFMRNWPYAWSLAQGEGSAVRGKVGVAVLPRGATQGGNAAALGGELLAVSKYTRNAGVAADLVMYMTSAAVQKERALAGSFNPTQPALYRDPDILKANPFMGELYGIFNRAVARPTSATGARYNQVSNEFWNAAHDVLAGRAKPDEALERLDASLNRLSRGAKWN
jgi:trehalose/maltose transport system substrate-binding protein